MARKGTDASRALEKQVSRVGVGVFVGGTTTNGGGENAGHHGSHAYFVKLALGDVRRRCIPHMA